jgi:hypothetical protein
LTRIAKDAIVQNGLKMAFEDVTVDLHGNVSRKETVKPFGLRRGASPRREAAVFGQGTSNG